MKRKNLIGILVSVIIFSFACKKKESTPDPAPSTTGSTSTPSAYYGVLYSNKFDFIMSGTLTPSGGASTCYFSNNTLLNSPTVSEAYSGSALNAGTVSINGTVMQRTLTAGGYYYNDSTSTLYNSPFNWVVSGGTGVPAINYTFSATRPTFTGWASIKDTIKLGQNNVIPLTGVTGADEIVINLFSGGFACKNLPGNATTTTFTSTDLIGFSPSTSGVFIITFYKVGYQTFGGQAYKFKTGYEIYKTVVVQ